MEEENKNQFYKEKIIEIINNLDDVSILAYLYYFIKEKIKAGN